MEEDFYSPSLMASLLSSGTQRQPTPQPVQAVPYNDYAPLDLGNWSISTMQGLMNNPGFSTDAVNQYIANQAAQGKEVVSLNPYASSTSVGPDSINANIWNAYNQFNPANPGATTGEVFRFDLGKNEGAAPAVLSSGTGYILTDGKGGNVIGTASTPEEMQALVDAANAQKYGWQLYQTNAEGSFTPGSQLFGETDTRPDGVLGALVNYGLPIAVGLLTGGVGSLPALGWAPSAAIMGATGLTSGVLGGKTIDDALLQGAITGGTAGLLKAPVLGGNNTIGNVIGGALDKVPGVGDALRFVNNTLGLGGSATSSVGSSAFDQAFSPDYAAWLAGGEGLAPAFGSAASGTLGSAGGNVAANAAANEIVVNAARSTAPLLTSALSSIFGSGLLNDSVLRDALSGRYTAPTTETPSSPQEKFDGILVKGNTGAGLNNLTPTVGGIVGTVPGAGTYYPDENLIEVQNKNRPTDLGDVAPGVVNQPGSTYDPISNEIKVTAQPKPTPYDSLIASVIGGVAPTLLNPNISKPTTTTGNKNSTLDDILKYYTLGSGLLDLLGGGGGGARQPVPSSAYGSLLGGVPNFGRGPFTPYPGDYEKYAFGPEWNFFGGAPASTPTNG